MSWRLPIPYPHIAKFTDPQMVEALLAHLSIETNEFFYGKAYPLFGALYSHYYTGCAEVVDFIHDIYIDIIEIKKETKKCKLQSFRYQCSLKNWIGIIAIHFCHARYKHRIDTVSSDVNDRFDNKTPSVLANISTLERYDVERILKSMNNERYRQIIRYRYLEGLSNEETASLLGMSMDNYYNKHRLAKVQYLIAIRKERLL